VLGDDAAVHRQHVDQLVVDDHPAVAVQDPAAGGRRVEDLHAVALGGDLELGAVEHLEIPQPHEQRAEQAGDHHPERRHPEPQRIGVHPA